MHHQQEDLDSLPITTSTVQRSRKSKKSRNSHQADKHSRASKKDDSPPSSSDSSSGTSSSSLPDRKSRTTRMSNKSRRKSKKGKPRGSSSSHDTSPTSSENDSPRTDGYETETSLDEPANSSSNDASSSEGSSSSGKTKTRKRREKRQLQRESKRLRDAETRDLALEKEEEIKPLRPVNNLFKDALDYLPIAWKIERQNVTKKRRGDSAARERTLRSTCTTSRLLVETQWPSSTSCARSRRHATPTTSTKAPPNVSSKTSSKAHLARNCASL